MRKPRIEYLPDLNSLLIRLDGTVVPTEFIQIYDLVLSHPSFKKGVHLIWNARNAEIKDITLGQLKSVVDHVKLNKSKRGKSCSAWVFARGENYETACLFKAAFAAQIGIGYEAFNSINEACEWLRSIQTRDSGNTSII